MPIVSLGADSAAPGPYANDAPNEPYRYPGRRWMVIRNQNPKNSPDPITRLNAALQSRYRIELEIGEGGEIQTAS